MARHAFTTFAIAALFSTQALAAAPCSIQPPAGTSDSELAKLAKLTKREAEKIALASIKSSKHASIESAELEAEHGCLIWSFDVRVKGKSGIHEVNVDAGDGHIISSKHEGPRKEAAEKAAEAKEARSKTKP